MLTEGYLKGWLTFKEKTPLSKVREEFILSRIERGILGDLMQFRTGVIASLASGSVNQKSIDATFKAVEDCVALTLPSIVERSTIKSKLKNIDLNNPANWKVLLEKKKRELKKET